jgi:hypothetical protein
VSEIMQWRLPCRLGPRRPLPCLRKTPEHRRRLTSGRSFTGAAHWNPRWRGNISSLLSHINLMATFCFNPESIWCNLSPTI